MDGSVDKISDFIGNFDNLTKNPEEFLILQNAAIKNSKQLVKQLYDFVKSVEEGNSNGKALPELIIKNFDEEQIWQEIELQNNDNIDKFTSGINWLSKRKDKLKFPVKLKDEDDGEEEGSANNLNENVSKMEVDGDEDSDSDNDDDSDDDFEDMEKEFTDNESVNSQDVSDKEKKEKKSKTKPSVVDDTFFKLAEMEEFLLAEEKREEDDEDNNADFGINLFEDIPSSENENEEEEEEQVRYKYKDFFQEPVNGETSENNNSEKLKLEDDEDVNENLDDEENINTRYKFKDFFKKPQREEKTKKSLHEDDENFAEDDTDDEEDEMDFNDDGETKKKHDDNDLSIGEEEDDNEEDSKNKNKRVKFDLSGDESDEEEDDKEKWKFRRNLNDEKGRSDEVKSTLEKRKERLSKHIMKLEVTALSDKPWQMKGEISATARPQNSLLEEVLEFDQTSRPAPVMTEATTERLEDIIIRRIKDKAWDDVERKLKPVETVNEFKKRLVLDQEKSKLSLAQIYEQEYIKQRDAATSVGLKAEDKEPEELPEHKEIKSMMVSLFAKLNALANFHYTPKQAAPDIKIVSNLPAVTIEEVAPVSASDGTLLAPEEVLGKKNKDLIGKEEREKTDKKRERRKKKSWQKTKRKLAEARELLKGQQSKKYSLENATKDLKKLSNSRGVQIGSSSDQKAVKTSTAFFSRLQDEVTSKVHGQLKEKKKDKLVVNAKKLKL